VETIRRSGFGVAEAEEGDGHGGIHGQNEEQKGGSGNRKITIMKAGRVWRVRIGHTRLFSPDLAEMIDCGWIGSP
jgi:hypothetical protein